MLPIAEKIFPKIPAVGKQPEVIIDRNVLILGKMGSGKTTLARCLCTVDDDPNQNFPQAGLDPVTEIPEIVKQRLDQYNFRFVDTPGFQGIYKKDKNALAENLDRVKIDTPTFNVIFLCFACDRFTLVDLAILQFIATECTAEMKARLHIVVTHCAPWKKDRVQGQIQARFGFLGDLTNRVTLVDLPDPRDFNDALQPAIIEQWQQTRLQLLEVVKAEREQVVTEKALATSCVVC